MHRMTLVAAALILTTATLALATENLLSNPSFELPEEPARDSQPSDWLEYHTHKPCTTVASDISRTGGQSLRISSPVAKEAHAAVFQRLNVVGGDKYTFQAYARNSETSPPRGSFSAILSIEWLDAEGNEIARDKGDSWTKKLSRLRWNDIRLTAKAPKDAAQANFVIQVLDSKGKRTGECYMDDAMVMNESGISEQH